MTMKIVEHRKWFYIISLIIIIPGLISLIWPGRGLNKGIDFTGGSLLQLRFEQSVEVKQVRTVLQEFGLEDSSIQKSGDKEIFIRTRMLNQTESDSVIGSLEQNIGKVKILRNEGVGPVIGKELTMKAIISILIAAVLMLVYISFRFEFSFGVGAIGALLHDVLLVLGIFSLFKLEVDGAFVAAMLTILGYSINDTIVVFDRIRENLGFKKKGDLVETINRSIMQTFNRSINTVLTVTFALAALLVFGGETIKIFSLALLIGIFSGAYSSICLASPIYYEMKLAGRK
jgi:preprotein translocase subunit SecF